MGDRKIAGWGRGEEGVTCVDCEGGLDRVVDGVESDHDREDVHSVTTHPLHASMSHPSI